MATKTMKNIFDNSLSLLDKTFDDAPQHIHNEASAAAWAVIIAAHDLFRAVSECCDKRLITAATIILRSASEYIAISKDIYINGRFGHHALNGFISKRKLLLGYLEISKISKQERQNIFKKSGKINVQILKRGKALNLVKKESSNKKIKQIQNNLQNSMKPKLLFSQTSSGDMYKIYSSMSDDVHGNIISIEDRHIKEEDNAIILEQSNPSDEEIDNIYQTANNLILSAIDAINTFSQAKT